jgi:hypothetical protein
VSVKFQPTPPRGAADDDRLNPRNPLAFHPPRGEQHRSTSARSRHCSFQPTLPRHEQPNPANQRVSHPVVSIHAPQAGSGSHLMNVEFLHPLSTHAPAQGAARLTEVAPRSVCRAVSIHAPPHTERPSSRSPGPACPCSFNPLPCMWSGVPAQAFPIRSRFQPTLLSGNGHGSAAAVARVIPFHPPPTRRAACSKRRSSPKTIRSFNPRSRAGSGPEMLNPVPREALFQPTLPRGERRLMRSASAVAASGFNPRSHMTWGKARLTPSTKGN